MRSDSTSWPAAPRLTSRPRRTAFPGARVCQPEYLAVGNHQRLHVLLLVHAVSLVSDLFERRSRAGRDRFWPMRKSPLPVRRHGGPPRRLSRRLAHDADRFAAIGVGWHGHDWTAPGRHVGRRQRVRRAAGCRRSIVLRRILFLVHPTRRLVGRDSRRRRPAPGSALRPVQYDRPGRRGRVAGLLGSFADYMKSLGFEGPRSVGPSFLSLRRRPDARRPALAVHQPPQEPSSRPMRHMIELDCCHTRSLCRTCSPCQLAHDASGPDFTTCSSWWWRCDVEQRLPETGASTATRAIRTSLRADQVEGDDERTGTSGTRQ